MPLLQGTTGAGDAAWSNAITSELATSKGVTGLTLIVGGRAAASLADSAELPQTGGQVAFDTTYSIPADTLGASTTLKVRAVVRISTSINGANSTSCQLRLGGAAILVSGASANTSAAGVRCLLEGTYTFRAAPGAAVAFSGVGTAVWGNQVAVVTMDPNAADAVPTAATNGALVVDVTCGCSAAGDGTGRYVLEQLYVEII